MSDLTRLDLKNVAFYVMMISSGLILNEQEWLKSFKTFGIVGFWPYATTIICDAIGTRVGECIFHKYENVSVVRIMCKMI